ncbi:hypothetical protein GCM10025781_13420 [Kocuria gwangalliensis]|uniref:Uncharacterized protein n=1 Tax=Kocuria gwangalliensis TaxID=501592 RepID=A0ABP8WYT7_9MICC
MTATGSTHQKPASAPAIPTQPRATLANSNACNGKTAMCGARWFRGGSGGQEFSGAAGVDSARPAGPVPSHGVAGAAVWLMR